MEGCRRRGASHGHAEAIMRFDVRNTGGVTLGTVDITNLKLLLRCETVRFARTVHTRDSGVGKRRFATVDMKVSRYWTERPTISEHGMYQPGRIDFCLIWDGPAAQLLAIRQFQPTSARVNPS